MTQSTSPTQSAVYQLVAGRLILKIDSQNNSWELADQTTSCRLMHAQSLAWMTPHFAGIEKADTQYTVTHHDHNALVMQSDSGSWGHTQLTIQTIPFADAFDVTLQIKVDQDLRLAQIECFSQATALNFFNLINYRNRHHSDSAWPELLLGAGCETDTTSQDWQFAPHPTLMFLQRNDEYLSWGSMQLPKDTFGMHFKASKHQLDRWMIDYGGYEHGLMLKAGQTFTSPTFRMRFSKQPDAYAAYEDFGKQLLDAGSCPNPAHRQASEQWWLDPLYCTWIDQCMFASYIPKDELQEQASDCNHPTRQALNEEMVRKAVTVIKEQNLPFKTILLDEGWHKARGLWEPHPDRFADLRRFVDELHAQGFKVVIWWAWPEIEKLVEDQIDPALLMGNGKRNRHGCLMYDFSNPKVQEDYLKPLFKMLFSDAPGCCNLDGIKTDFQADKIHAEMPLTDPAWRGEENYLCRMHELFYSTLKTIKPDAVHIGCAGHYWLSQYIDINRTYDVHGSNVLEHACRAKMLYSTTFNAPVAYDFHNHLEHLEEFFDSAKEHGCSVEVGNVLCTKQDVHAKAQPADAAYWKRLLSKLTPVVGLLVMLVSMFMGNQVSAQESGQDILPVFARAHNGLPLRAAVLGGSITQAGKGWITDWLVEQFPKADITMRNAGMSATGSSLGIFRVNRDVITAQPDIVFIEYAVNDSGLSDEDAIRYTESIVVRLKSLPHPPAIVFLQAAAKNGSRRHRHQQVAGHYNLLDIDLQVAVDDYLKQSGKPWSAVMSDSVHPNVQGHALYAKVIANKLSPFVQQSKQHSGEYKEQLPKPLSSKPLILDGQMMLLDPQSGWNTMNSIPHWWNKFFNGAITSKTPGAELTLTARGNMIGLLYPLDAKTGGTFYASLDGQNPILIDQSYRGGYSFRIFGKDMTACEHQLKIAVANPIDGSAGDVMLGYLLVAGQTQSSREVVAFNPIDLSNIAKRKYKAIPASAWQWSGPYGGSQKTGAGATEDFQTAFAPENNPADVNWQAVNTTGNRVDFAAFTGVKDRGVCYAKTTISRDSVGQVSLALKLDYFAKIWVNGQLAHTIDRSKHGGMSPNMPIILPVTLQAGENLILIKVHSGSGGHMFAMSIGDNTH